MSAQRAPVTSVGDLVTWLDDVLDHLQLERVHLLGYSEGGWIAGSHAALSTRRDRLASVTLVEPGGAIERIPTRFLIQMIGRATRAMASRDRTARARPLQHLAQRQHRAPPTHRSNSSRSPWGPTANGCPDPAASTTTSSAASRHHPQHRRRWPRTPSFIDPTKVADRARALIPDLTIDITPNAGHGLLFQYPNELTSRINHFLSLHD